MYTYEYERIHVEIGWVLRENRTFGTEENYQEIIDQRAKDGWRYVGFIPAVQLGGGLISEMDLVFEKKEEQPE